MPVIDTDPRLLKKSADAALHAAEQSWVHMEAEYAGKIPELMETLAPEGPYGYTIIPQVHPDGGVKLPIMSTREGIEQAYKMIRGASDLLSSEAIVEIRGSWYTFTEAVNRGRLKGQTDVREAQTAALFPSSSGKGITGELVWARVPLSNLGRNKKPVDEVANRLSLRRELLALHDRYLEALRASDVEGVLNAMDDGVQAAVRNYVEDTGALISLDGKEAHRTYYRNLFETYDVQSVEFLDRVAQEWYVFAELRFTARPRAGGGETVAFQTAEFFIPASDGRFIARIGHGTDPASV
jgi:hypothetical protein